VVLHQRFWHLTRRKSYQDLGLCETLDTCGFLTRDIGTFSRVSDVLLCTDGYPLPRESRLLIAQGLFRIPTTLALNAMLPIVANMETATRKAAQVTATIRSLEDIWWAFRYIHGWEAWQTYGALIEQYGLQLGPDVTTRFAFARNVTAAELENARTIRRDTTAYLRSLLGNDGVLILPTMPDIAPLTDTADDELVAYRDLAGQILCLASLSGFPQQSLPLCCRDGAPLGISLMRSKDRLVFATGAPGRATKMGAGVDGAPQPKRLENEFMVPCPIASLASLPRRVAGELTTQGSADPLRRFWPCSSSPLAHAPLCSGTFQTSPLQAW